MLRTGVLTKIKRRADRVRSKAKPVKATPCVVIGSLYLTQRTETAGERYAITLTRGSKCVSTRAVSPQDGIVRFDEVFSLPCTLYRKADGESASSRGTANFEEKSNSSVGEFGRRVESESNLFGFVEVETTTTLK